MFLAWWDPDRKKSAEAKLADAIARFEKKWGEKPKAALVNVKHADALANVVDVEVRVVGHVAPNTFFVGDDEFDPVPK